MKNDPSEPIRRQEMSEINSKAAERKQLEQECGQVWTTQELQEDFEVLSFLAPYVIVQRKSDGVRGSMQFQHSPRFFFNFKED